MPKRAPDISIPALKLLDRSAGPIGLQLTQCLRDEIVSGRLKAGDRLPSTRAIAGALGLARGTVVEAFNQLIAEGYLESRIGKGTCVAEIAEDIFPHPLEQTEPPDHDEVLRWSRLPGQVCGKIKLKPMSSCCEFAHQIMGGMPPMI